MGHLFTSESVTAGHPDKLCDLISDSILDECLRLDKRARVAVEVFVKSLDNVQGNEHKSHIIIGGEITLDSNYDIDYEEIARRCAINVGYSDIEIGMDASDRELCKVQVLINRQSEEIGKGVVHTDNINLDQGAGDQGIVFGYANNESENFDLTSGAFMPLPILLAHKLVNLITEKRKSHELEWARPDGKSQVTIAYDDNGNPKHVDTIILAIQHKDMLSDNTFNNVEEELDFIIGEVIKKIISPLIPKELVTDDLKIIINGTGRFCKGGPIADAGLTGRKIIVDTYGGSGRHGGGAFSGKDPTKVDRSAAYMARWAAKHVVFSGLARECEIQIAYSIGVATPISVNIKVDTFGTSSISNNEIAKRIKNVFDFRPSNIIRELDLLNPIYSITTSGGHFGRKPRKKYFSWEKINEDKIIKLTENY